jgi:hypothetical protein
MWRFTFQRFQTAPRGGGLPFQRARRRGQVLLFPGCAKTDKFMLHMQHKLVHGYRPLSVRNCRPASRSTSTRRRHACCPR